MTDRAWRSVTDYREELLALVSRLDAETVAVTEGGGRILAERTLARDGVPAFDASAMDGYAVRWVDIAAAAAMPVALPVVADLPAGASLTTPVEAGQAVRIMTGAPVPAGVDTVVPVEATDGGAHLVRVRRPPAAGCGAHIRRAHEDVRPGDVVARVGQVLSPGILATLAATGVASVPVTRRPRVAVASTGTELQPAAATLGPGQIHESNSSFVGPAIGESGAFLISRPPIRDDAEAMRSALDDMTRDADLVVLTGGAGRGAHDVPGQVLSEAAQCAFRQVRMQPGKPQGWARWNDVPVLLLPGNPVAAAVSVLVFVFPVIDKLLSRSVDAPWTALAGQRFEVRGEREQYIPCRLLPGSDGVVRVIPSHVRGLGSHLVSSLADADVLAVVPDGVAQVDPGQPLAIVPMRHTRGLRAGFDDGHSATVADA